MFCFYNAESSRFGYHAKKEDLKKYYEDVKKREFKIEKVDNEYDIDEQFKGINFDKRH